MPRRKALHAHADAQTKRLTNGFPKKWENYWAALCLHFAYYNFVRIHRTLRVTPAMAAGITERVWDLAELLA